MDGGGGSCRRDYVSEDRPAMATCSATGKPDTVVKVIPGHATSLQIPRQCIRSIFTEIRTFKSFGWVVKVKKPEMFKSTKIM